MRTQLARFTPGPCQPLAAYEAFQDGPEYLDEAARALDAWIIRVLKLAEANSHDRC